MIIDVHTHYYPPAYLDALRKGPSNVQVTMDTEGNPRLHYPGDSHIAVPGHRDIEHRLNVYAGHGIDCQVLTLTTPGTHVETPQRAVELARVVNDAFAAEVAKRNGRCLALATLPLNDPAASVKELERACTHLKLKGAMLFSNVNGVALWDDRYRPLYEAADSFGAVLHIHPTSPVGVEAMTKYWLMPLVGFLMDTTLAAAGIVFSGIPVRYPKIKWMLGHLGGAVPYIAERFDRGFRAFAECRKNIDRPPSEYLKQFYFDTVNFDAGALELAIRFAGVGHLLAGSDYPHQVGSLELMLKSLRALAIEEEARAAILGGNAAKLFGLTADPA